MVNQDTAELPGEVLERIKYEIEYGDERSLLSLEREIERIEKGIDLVRDVSEFPEPEWLVEGLIVRDGLTLLYGDSGTGKTTLCLYLADAVQKGEDLFGLKTKKGKVIFVEQDESGPLLKSHRDKIDLPEDLSLMKEDVIWNGREFNKEFEELLYYYVPGVVVIDAYTSLGIPDITRPESALVQDELRRLGKREGTAILLIHHENASGGQLGSNLHVAKMDSIVNLKETEEGRIMLTQEKVRGMKFEPKSLNFDPNTLEMTGTDMSVKDQVSELLEHGLEDKEIENRFPPKSRDTVKRYLRDARKWKSN